MHRLLSKVVGVAVPPETSSAVRVARTFLMVVGGPTIETVVDVVSFQKK